ncbi:MAG: NADH-quinone oxidoreductase subunit A [Verrucomicrobiota bacterium]
MIEAYGPLIIQFGLALAVAVGGVVTSMILGKKGRKDSGKDKAYECGKDTIGPAQPRFSVKFYLVAMIFILFDIEVIFMYPWAVSFRDLLGTLGWSLLWSMVLFVLLLEVGHWYAYKKGVFDWNKR